MQLKYRLIDIEKNISILKYTFMSRISKQSNENTQDSLANPEFRGPDLVGLVKVQIRQKRPKNVFNEHMKLNEI